MRLSLGAAAVLATWAVSDAFTPSFRLGPSASSFTHQLQVLAPRSAPQKSMQLNMMFDQLSDALSAVAKNFGKQR
jgi:hypothetical protein